MLSLPSYSQWGQLWSGKRLGTTPLTMATHGCYVTSLSIAMHNYGFNLDPGEVVDKLNAVGGFTKEGLMSYDGVMRAFPSLYFQAREYTSNDPSPNIQKMGVEVAIDNISRYLALGMPVILAVDNLFDDKIPDHAVCCVDAPSDQPHLWRISDPDGGRAITFESKYGAVKDNLYGYIAIIGSPTGHPDYTNYQLALRDIASRAGGVAWKAAQMKQGKHIDTYSREILDQLL